MKVTAVNGSPHKEGNTYLALKLAADTLEGLGIETEIIHIGAKPMRGCIACYACTNGKCALSDEDFESWTEKMYESDGILLGSPVYYAGVNGTLKSFLDRAFFQSGGRMKNKVGAGIAVCRRSGGMTTFEQLNAYFLISEMVIAPSFYWNIGHGFSPGDILKDKEAVSTIELLASNMAWLLKMKDETKGVVPLPESKTRQRMNFIR